MRIEEVKNVITKGASAGGLSAVSALLASLPEDLDAAVFIVIHISKAAIEENIISLLNKKSKLKVSIPKNGTKIENGKVYLAPVDHHMMLSEDTIITSRGANASDSVGSDTTMSDMSGTAPMQDSVATDTTKTDSAATTTGTTTTPQ